MNTTDLHTNQLDLDHAVVNEICAAGEGRTDIDRE